MARESTNEIVRVPGVMHTRAAFEPASFNDEKGTVDVTWTTGARGLRTPWFGERYYEELEVSEKAVDLSRLNNGAPLLNAHDGYSLQGVIGVVERAWISKGEGRATVRFSERDEVKPIKADVKAGIIRHLSVGYSVQKYEKVEGGDEKIPVMRATRWTPAEVSFVPMGFDDAAVARSSRTPEFIDVPVETRGIDPHEEKKMSEATQPPAPAQPDASARQSEIDAAVRADRERATGIRALVEKADLGRALADELVAGGKTLDEARAAVLSAMLERSEKTPVSGHLRITGGETDREKFMRGAEAWLVMRSGHGETVARAVKSGRLTGVENDPGEFRGMTLIGLARESLERAGISTRRMTDERIAELAMMKRAPGMATASDFPILLENVTNKVLLSAYDVTPHEWPRFCGRGSVSNFHDHNRYRKGAFGTLDPVNDHGELKNKSIPDGETRAVSVGTYGNTLGITRKTLIQDDMGVFTDLASAFGASAMNTVEAAVWALVKANSGLGSNYDANPLFHSSRANINTVGSALSAAGLDADAVIMARQAAPSGTTVLNLVPAVLVLPREFRAQASIINNDALDPDTGSKQGKSNPARNMFRDIVSSAQLTGTRRYLFADPAVAPVIEVTFLQGQEAPQMESQEGFEVLGLQWRVFLDFGVNMVDYRGAVTNAGQ
jgi:hypothetical protein